MTGPSRAARRVRPTLRWIGLAALLALPAAAQETADILIELAPGGSETLTFDADVATAFVADPATADVEVLDNRRVFVLGGAHGVTGLKVYGEGGVLLGAYAVRVNVQSSFARTIAARLTGDAGRIDVESIGDALFVSGTAADPSEAERVLRGIRAVSGETPVVDALALDTPAQVNLEVLISEVSRNVTQQLGIDWSVDLNPFENPLRTWVTGTGVRLATGSLSVDDSLEQTVQFFPVSPAGVVAEEPQFANEIQELAVVQPLAPRGGDGRMLLSHTKEVNSGKYRASAFLEALAENGLAVVHARPNLTAVSGQPAEFFSGLEIPVPTITDRGVIGTEYRQTGVSLTFTP
ncbi:MAG: pilus assembly protein N-terminal domain-containing protein, partial [Gammaproteobacteria bacterium]|nr:pilus assembly protein N-terminal domain-containing protein [Gammaproteobacteria bacterium]